jgi:hypothetical protein
MRWRIAIETWPHSTGKGQAVDREAAGAVDGERYFYVDAEDVTEALKLAQCIAMGIESHPAVWKAPIYGVHRYDLLRPAKKAAD